MIQRPLLSALISFCLVVSGFSPGLWAGVGQPKKLLLIGQGPDGHPPTTHEYMAGVRILERLLAPVPNLKTTVVRADEPWPEGPALIDQADGIVMFVTQGAQWIQLDPKRQAALRRLARRGGGIVALHWAVGAIDGKYIEGQLELLGGTRGGPRRKYQVLETTVHLVDPKHPISSGLSDFKVRDEFYYRLDFAKPAGSIHPLLSALIDGQEETIAWSWERPEGGRSLGFVGLHFHSNWSLPEYRRWVAQGTLWTLGLPVPDAGQNVEIDPQVLRLN